MGRTNLHIDKLGAWVHRAARSLDVRLASPPMRRRRRPAKRRATLNSDQQRIGACRPRFCWAFRVVEQSRAVSFAPHCVFLSPSVCFFFFSLCFRSLLSFSRALHLSLDFALASLLGSLKGGATCTHTSPVEAAPLGRRDKRTAFPSVL